MDRPNPSNKPKSGGFMGTIRGAFRRAAKVFEPLFRAAGEERPTLHELRLDADEYAVKRKLGRSFFTHRITANTRAARLASLTHAEHLLARDRGWTR